MKFPILVTLSTLLMSQPVYVLTYTQGGATCKEFRNTEACILSIGKRYLFIDRRGEKHIYEECSSQVVQKHLHVSCRSLYEGGLVEWRGYNYMTFIHTLKGTQATLHDIMFERSEELKD